MSNDTGRAAAEFSRQARIALEVAGPRAIAALQAFGEAMRKSDPPMARHNDALVRLGLIAKGDTKK